MAVLYAPYIEGIIPAFCGDTISVPYSMNYAVGEAEITGFALRIKTIQNNIYIGTLETTNYGNDIATFTLTEDIKNKMNIGQYYKVQLAYMQDTRIGDFSTIATCKYAGKPKIYIEGLNFKNINAHHKIYKGIYYQDKDYSEKVYSYQFLIYNNNEDIVFDSGELIHNTETDIDIHSSADILEYSEELKQNSNYTIQYIVTTINKMIVKSPKYKIIQQEGLYTNLGISIIPVLDEENGVVNLNFIGDMDENNKEKLLNTVLVLSRVNHKYPNKWEELTKITVNYDYISNYTYNDFTVEQGAIYTYSLQQENRKGLRTERIKSKPIKITFEHAYLYDGNRQLKIKFNPKVSSFKSTILENKVNTLGKQHPYIFRNGIVNFKEFPISGLISYLIDNEEFFLKSKDYEKDNYRINYRKDTKTTEDSDLEYREKTVFVDNDNFYSERLFKLVVLDWLNDGKPKIFRSPAEGNYLIRLLNTSLSPIDPLGRMIHTFNTNAVEIAEFTYENLCKFGIINPAIPPDTTYCWKSFDLEKNPISKNKSKNLLDQTKILADAIDCRDFNPGDKIKIVFVNGESVDLTIGVTGSYKVSNAGLISQIIVPEDQNGRAQRGFITIRYQGKRTNSFDIIEELTPMIKPGIQWWGKGKEGHYLINSIDNTSQIEISKKENYDFINWMQSNPCTILNNINTLEIYFRPIYPLYIKENSRIKFTDKGKIDLNNSDIYRDNLGRHRVTDIDILDATSLYHIMLMEKNTTHLYNNTYLDAYYEDIFEAKDYGSKIYCNGIEIETNKISQYQIKNINFSSLTADRGVMIDAICNLVNIEYNFQRQLEISKINKFLHDPFKYEDLNGKIVNSTGKEVLFPPNYYSFLAEQSKYKDFKELVITSWNKYVYDNILKKDIGSIKEQEIQFKQELAYKTLYNDLYKKIIIPAIKEELEKKESGYGQLFNR